MPADPNAGVEGGEGVKKKKAAKKKKK